MKVIYTYTDEAPALATHSFLPDHRGVRRQGRGRGRDPRHLTGRPHPRAVPGPADRRPAGSRLAGRARRAGQDPRGQHHQAAQHQRLDPAAEGGDPGAAGRGLRHPGLPGEPADRRGARRPGRLRRGQGQRGQPGAARGQLRPPRSGVGEELRPQPPALDGRVVAESTSHVATMDDGDFRHSEASVTWPRPTSCASSTSPRTAPSPC